MSGLSPKLPISKDLIDGFRLTKTYQEMIRQNFKNLMLTSPGERVMDPNFGVGLRNYLFSQMTSDTYDEINERIRTQVNRYMPFVEVEEVIFDDTLAENQSENTLGIRVEYLISPLSVKDSFEAAISAAGRG